MNFFEALTAAVNDGKKIRQVDWTKTVYATADETGQLHLYNDDKTGGKYDDDRVTVSYWALAKASWEFYTKSCRFQDVDEGETFTINSYIRHQYTKIKETFGINAIRDDRKAVFIDKDNCVTIEV